MGRWLLQALWRYRLFIFVTLSFGAWSLHVIKDDKNPNADLSRGVYSDHFTHMNTTRLFPAIGLDIYRWPIASNGRRYTPEEQALLPPMLRGEVYHFRDWPFNKPLHAAWSNRPRLHPPGDLILTAPAALAYHFTSLTYAGVNHLLIILFLFYAHISIYVLLRLVKNTPGPSVISFLAFLLVYFEVVHWALEGVYEPMVITPLVLCSRWSREGRWLAAICAYCLATVIHFRAFFFAPWVLYAAFSLIRTKHWKTWRGWDFAALPAIAALSSASLGVFWILWPVLKELPYGHNAVALGNTIINKPAITALVVAMLFVMSLFAYCRSWMDLTLVAWVGLLLVSLREAYPWDALTLLSWLGASVGKNALPKMGIIRDVRLFFILFIGVLVFGSSMTPVWIQQLVLPTPTH